MNSVEGKENKRLLRENLLSGRKRRNGSVIWLFFCAFVLVICVGHPVDSRLLSWLLGAGQFIASPCFAFGLVTIQAAQ